MQTLKQRKRVQLEGWASRDAPGSGDDTDVVDTGTFSTASSSSSPADATTMTTMLLLTPTTDDVPLSIGESFEFEYDDAEQLGAM